MPVVTSFNVRKAITGQDIQDINYSLNNQRRKVRTMLLLLYTLWVDGVSIDPPPSQFEVVEPPQS